MIIQTKGIVFQSTKYSDTSLIVKILTEELGLQSYIVKGVRRPKSRMKPSFFEPLTLLDMEVYHKPNQNLHHLREVRVDVPWHHIPFSIEKQSILLFLNEILYKCVREEVSDKALFSWIYHSLIWFDLEEKDFLNFHLLFLVQLSRFLGFYPKDTVEATEAIRVFDIQEGRFSAHRPLHPFFMEGTAATKLFLLMQTSFETLKNLRLTTRERRLVLEGLLAFYQLHLPELGKIKSLEVLRMMLGIKAENHTNRK
jgi:DNA repair protein RecO (recombination protein O)